MVVSVRYLTQRRRAAEDISNSRDVIPGLVPGTHFPEAVIVLHRLWKMGGRDKPGHDVSG
jgi:hypothetical protein